MFVNRISDTLEGQTELNITTKIFVAKKFGKIPALKILYNES